MPGTDFYSSFHGSRLGFRGASVLSSSPLSPIFSLRLPDPFVPFSTPPLSLSNDFSGVNKFPSGSIGVVSCLKGVMSLAVKPSQELEGVSLLRASQNNPSEAFVPERCMSLESDSAQLEDFLCEGISPSKMDSIKSVLGSLNVKIVKYNEGRFQFTKSNCSFVEKVYSRRKNRPSSIVPRSP